MFSLIFPNLDGSLGGRNWGRWVQLQDEPVSPGDEPSEAGHHAE